MSQIATSLRRCIISSCVCAKAHRPCVLPRRGYARMLPGAWQPDPPYLLGPFSNRGLPDAITAPLACPANNARAEQKQAQAAGGNRVRFEGVPQATRVRSRFTGDARALSRACRLHAMATHRTSSVRGVSRSVPAHPPSPVCPCVLPILRRSGTLNRHPACSACPRRMADGVSDACSPPDPSLQMDDGPSREFEVLPRFAGPFLGKAAAGWTGML